MILFVLKLQFVIEKVVCIKYTDPPKFLALLLEKIDSVICILLVSVDSKYMLPP